MKKVLLCSNTKGILSDIEDVLVTVDDFELEICEDGIDAGAEVAEKIKPDLLIVNLSDLADNTHMSLLRAQTGMPGMAVLALGTTLEYTSFLAKYVGGNVNQLERPVETDKAIATISRALSLSEDETKAALGEAMGEGGIDNVPKVLLVDDNAVILRSLKKILENDYKVSVVTSGEAALRKIYENRPDIVLLDYEMPGVDGLEVLSRIRKDGSIADLTVIFLTGINDMEHISAVMALSPAGYLLKPIEKEQLISAIQAALSGRSANSSL